jgi:hypothetical protein
MPFEVLEWYARHCRSVSSIEWVGLAQSSAQWMLERFPGYVPGDAGSLIIAYIPMDSALKFAKAPEPVKGLQHRMRAELPANAPDMPMDRTEREIQDRRYLDLI